MFEPIDITITDPRTFDGNPYEVAARAVKQAEGTLRAYLQALDAAFYMARNADMERNIALGNKPAGSEYASGPQGRIFDRLDSEATEHLKLLLRLGQAVEFDPKHPPKVRG